MNDILLNTALGKKTNYLNPYSPELLQPIPRYSTRVALGIKTTKPFYGFDIWNSYEFSWLNLKGKPQVGIAEFIFSDNTENLIESKSFKLYLNSFSDLRIPDKLALRAALIKDLSNATKGEVQVNLFTLEEYSQKSFFEDLNRTSGTCLDNLDIEVETYEYAPEYLATTPEFISETFYTHLFKSNCPVTQQPDWGSIWITYRGQKIHRENLLKYLISYRKSSEFGEQCIERIYIDILKRCSPEKLTVYGRFTRRGGLDINPYRTNFGPKEIANLRTFRQ